MTANSDAPAVRAREARAGVAKYFPIGLLVISFAALSIALPTSLRPPQQPPNTSAELSPDAPPDANQDSIVSVLNRGMSGTAGAGQGVAADTTAGPGGGPPPLAATAVTVKPPSRSCPRGFGVPPRQVESLYSAPCAPAWQGDNGGSTWKGVDANEVRVVLGGYYAGDVYQVASDPGEITTEPRYDQKGQESDANRTSRVLQQYFNQNFQFWGRRLRLFFDYPSGDGDRAQREAAAKAQIVRDDEEYHAFLVHTDVAPSLEDAARRNMAGYSGYMIHPAKAYFTRNQPYIQGWQMDGNHLMQMMSEYVCKKLAGKPAAFAGGAEQNQRRKFGFIHVDGSEWGDNGFGTLPDLVKAQCNETVVEQSYGSSSDASQYATAITKLRAEGVTSVVTATDPIFIASFLSQADAQSYFPEWINTGMWLTDRNYIPTQFGYSRAQWTHAFGFALNSMTQPREMTDWYRAYKSIDPTGEPFYKAGFYFPLLMQIANGIQLAGPTLTPETFRAGLQKMPPRPMQPNWLVGGGYAPGQTNFADDVAEVYWDPVPIDNSGEGDLRGQPGMWRYVRCGQRYRLGDIPKEDPQLFKGGCLTAADAG